MWTLPFAALFALTSPGWCSWPVGPSFVDAPRNVTVREGRHAFLPCRVTNLGDRSVTWMRRRHLHIITAGLLTYSPDDRHRVLHPDGTDEWTLLIRHAQPGDSGWYECQVNSDPKITTPVLLVVKDKSLDDPFYQPDHEGTDNGTQVRIEGPRERYIQAGSILGVTCLVEHLVRAVDSVVWFKGAARLDYDSPRGGIAIQTEKTDARTVSRLRLSAVSATDSGRYTCRPDSGGSASVSVHVQSGQPHAAVHQGAHNAAAEAIISPPHSLLLLFIFLHLPLFQSLPRLVVSR
ncbi:basement membrane-specific heparan sulfate proteoglycan core protein-like [Eriocheir sinensis]|uniref:basement membrane-specific heparan sulfate proteoglycan core protein-like n=1 Tax=Eriocheir sinensis TaxID=95602 RepID=UPI0021C6D5B9|nr:basement membrane-specific heparan sulfate proteoglycan core protein-like [Eriocheir sinensis]XP_050729969.1 basement membrane-specific heparan sulfate proteoglycan core protein-like [Eriocheir sinensis]